MHKKSTDDLHQELINAPDLDKFLSDNRKSFNTESISEHLYQLFLKKDITKAMLAKHSAISEVYLHQVLAGRRKPSRNRVLCLCMGLSATLEETQRLLKLCGYAELFPKDRRDAIIIYGLTHQMDLFSVNDKLYTEDEEALF